jgi:4-oxalocrotonate tautomerase
MPYCHVRIAGKATPALTQQIGALLTQLAVTKLGKVASVAAIDVQYTDPACWYVGGQSLAQLHQTSFFVAINVTAGTNTPAEKAAFIAATYAGLAKLLPNATTTSYVAVQDIAGDDWGYGGVTQAARKRL